MGRALSSAARLVVSLAPAVLLVGCGICSLTGPRADENAVGTRIAQGVAGTVAAALTVTAAAPVPSATRVVTVAPAATAAAAAGTMTAKSPTATATKVATAVPQGVTSPTVAPARDLPATPPRSPDSPDAIYALQEERKIGPYAVRLWRDTAVDSPVYGGIVTISAAGQATVQINDATGLDPLTGQDIIGEGHPSVIVQTYSGGAHCCFSTYAYDLGPTLSLVLQTPMSNCGGEFRDLDGDGVYEYVTCDDSFAYGFCPFAGSPMVLVIMQYGQGQGYVPASPAWAEQYADDIARDTVLAEQGKAGEMGEEDSTTKCSVLPVVLDYLYSGDVDGAWAELERVYPYDDRAAFRAQIEEILGKSPFYVAP